MSKKGEQELNHVEPLTNEYQQIHVNPVRKASRDFKGQVEGSRKDRKFRAWHSDNPVTILSNPVNWNWVPLPWRQRPALLPLSRLGIYSSDLKQDIVKSSINLRASIKLTAPVQVDYSSDRSDARFWYGLILISVRKAVHICSHLLSQWLAFSQLRMLGLPDWATNLGWELSGDEPMPTILDLETT